MKDFEWQPAAGWSTSSSSETRQLDRVWQRLNPEAFISVRDESSRSASETPSASGRWSCWSSGSPVVASRGQREIVRATLRDSGMTPSCNANS